MNMTEMIFDGLVWLIGGLVVLYMIRRYWVIFTHRNKDQEACGSGKGACPSCPTRCHDANSH